jgi:hypothetical protein
VGWHVQCNGNIRAVYRDFGVNVKERKKLLGRPRRRWNDNIKMDI